MKMQQPIWRAITLSIILLATVTCAFPTLGQQPLLPTSTPIQLPTALPNAIGGRGGEIRGGNGQSGTGGGNGQNGTGGTNNSASSPVPTSNPTPGATGPFIVKQIESLGHETIAGEVCSIADAFTVAVTAPEVTFAFKFVPEVAEHGKWTYAYSIPRAGETHDASGKYTTSPAGSDGTLLLSMTGSDHVIFKGFDGSPSVKYEFDLVPSRNTACPKTQ
jgi:hypothetical protein